MATILGTCFLSFAITHLLYFRDVREEIRAFVSRLRGRVQNRSRIQLIRRQNGVGLPAVASYKMSYNDKRPIAGRKPGTEQFRSVFRRSTKSRPVPRKDLAVARRNLGKDHAALGVVRLVVGAEGTQGSSSI